jgi:hypothetical protein
VSADRSGYSTQLIQDCTREFIKTRIISTDIPPCSPALYLRSIINHELIKIPKNNRLIREAYDLKNVVMANGNIKVDHPAKKSDLKGIGFPEESPDNLGSKDQWDALASSVYSLRQSLIDNDDYGIKIFNFELIMMLLKFKSRIYHETNILAENNELLQFPNNQKNIEIFKKNNNTLINDLIIKNKEETWFNNLDNYKDIKEVLLVLPKYEIDININNVWYEHAGNLFTFNIIIKRGDENNKKQLGYLHSNNYDDNYNEQAFVIIFDCNNKRINYFEKIEFECSYE